MSTFDFGFGPVPAHQHTNGGGWVADTARVEDSAYIGPSAQVTGNARVSGNAQVSGDAQVSGNARVSDNAWVSGNAQVSGNAKIAKPSDYLLIGPIGSRADFLTWTRSDNCIATGCFRGTVKEFLAAVRETHGDNEYAKAYRAAVKFIRAMEKLA